MENGEGECGLQDGVRPVALTLGLWRGNWKGCVWEQGNAMRPLHTLCRVSVQLSGKRTL